MMENLRAEYEVDCSRQKQRIMELRDENNELKEQLKSLEDNKSMLVGAMISAQKSSRDIIESAKLTAADMISAAEERVQKLEESIQRIRGGFSELKEHCEKIMGAIDAEEAAAGIDETVFTVKKRKIKSA